MIFFRICLLYVVELNNYKENFIDYLTADQILYFDISRDVRADVPNIKIYFIEKGSKTFNTRLIHY
jgi:hypothetical protein